MFYLLGLLAKAGHGKTTVARHLCEKYGVEERSLAVPLKRAVQRVFGFSDAQLWGSQAEKNTPDPRYGFSPRWILQRLGTDGLREHFGADIHQRALLRALRQEEVERADGSASGPVRPHVYVIDDLRFPDDVRMVVTGGADFQGAVMKIVATDVPASGHASHASELAIDQVPPRDIAATVISSRAAGVPHLLAAVDAALRTTPALAPLRAILGIEPPR